LSRFRLFSYLPSKPSNKAVSDGAISFYLDHYVRTRVSKVTYGNFCHIPFDSNDPEHQLRIKNTFISVSGNKRISDSFDVILPKVRSETAQLCRSKSSLAPCRTHKSRRRKNSARPTSASRRRGPTSRRPPSTCGATEESWPIPNGRTKT